MAEQCDDKTVLNQSDGKEFLCDNPISLDEIEDGLWLGSFTAATDMDTLKQHNISHILTLDICPLPTHITEKPYLTTKYIQVSDTPKDDLLGHFDECLEFIENTRASGKNILVHCYYGVSRSATIVAAYIMRKHRISTTPALARVKAKRVFVHPNAGFMIQLRLFFKMGWKIDSSHEKYKVYRLRLAADKVRKARILPQCCMDLIKPDPALTQSNPEPIVYRCRKCRRILAAKSNLVTHTRINSENNASSSVRAHIEPQNTYDPLAVDAITSAPLVDDITTVQLVDTTNINPLMNTITNVPLVEEIAQKIRVLSVHSSERSSEGNNERCKEIIFVEPITWMTEVFKQTHGKINCPNCKSKLGSFTWINGCNCPCGKQVSPAFYLVPSKVELTRSVQNVQVTV